jgi:hypothetical protein
MYQEYNLTMGGVDLKDQMVWLYLGERKQAKKWYVKFFKRLVNVAVRNVFVVCNSRNKTHHLTYRLELIKALIFTYKPQVASPAGPVRLSVNHPPERLFVRHFIEKIPATEGRGEKKEKNQKCCAVSFCERKGRSQYTSVRTAE